MTNPGLTPGDHACCPYCSDFTAEVYHFHFGNPCPAVPDGD